MDAKAARSNGKGRHQEQDRYCHKHQCDSIPPHHAVSPEIFQYRYSDLGQRSIPTMG
jgi:hypothetical protein